jgi:hypothetical protein
MLRLPDALEHGIEDVTVVNCYEIIAAFFKDIHAVSLLFSRLPM